MAWTRRGLRAYGVVGDVAGTGSYVAHFNSYNTTYGSIGGMILLMLWLFLSNVTPLVGPVHVSSTRSDDAAYGVPLTRCRRSARAPVRRLPESSPRTSDRPPPRRE